MMDRIVTTKRGCKVRVLEAGSGTPLVFLHGAGERGQGTRLGGQGRQAGRDPCGCFGRCRQ